MKGRVCNPDNWRSIERALLKNVALVLEGKHPHKKIPSCATLEMYDEIPIFIPVDIMEDAVELVAQKLLGDSIPGGTDLEALQGWILKLGKDRKRLSTSVETFVDCIANGSLPWVAYRVFTSGRLIVLDKQTGVGPVGVRETWRRLFAEIVLKAKVPEDTMACQDDHLHAGLKAEIDGAFHRVQAIWDKKFTMDD